MKTTWLINGDCLEILPTLPEKSVDAIITDLPYGTTQCVWDAVIPLEPMWKAVKHILKPDGVFVTTASQPFTSLLISSNLDWFKYSWVWDKVLGTGHLNAKIMPLKSHEDVCVFSAATNGNYTYNPIMNKRGKIRDKGGSGGGGDGNSVFGRYGDHKSKNNIYYPTSIFTFSNGDRTRPEVGFHPTQKPVALYEYLIRTYTNPGDTVLDFCMGSGTTGVACVKTDRNFIGIEKREDYFIVTGERVRATQSQPALFLEAQ
jgi:site-specific DNA-methyltransferase (adenine-specific)